MKFQSCSVSAYSVDFQREHLEENFYLEYFQWLFLPVMMVFHTASGISMCHLQTCEVTALDSWPESTIFLSNWSERETETSFLLLLPFFFLSTGMSLQAKQHVKAKEILTSSIVPIQWQYRCFQVFGWAVPYLWGKPYCPFQKYPCLTFTGRNTIHNACI